MTAPLDLPALKALIAAASEGPWTLDIGDHTDRYVHVEDADERTVLYKYNGGNKLAGDKDEANAALIAAARTALPGLVGELEAERAESARLLEALKKLHDAVDSCVDLTPALLFKTRFVIADATARAALNGGQA